MVGETTVFTAGKAFLVCALRKFRESNGVIYQATANNTFNPTHYSVVWFSQFRYRFIIVQTNRHCKGRLNAALDVHEKIKSKSKSLLIPNIFKV